MRSARGQVMRWRSQEDNGKRGRERERESCASARPRRDMCLAHREHAPYPQAAAADLRARRGEWVVRADMEEVKEEVRASQNADGEEHVKSAYPCF